MRDSDLVWFNEVDKEDILYVGGKGANLGVSCTGPVQFSSTLKL